ncbi:3-hydroxybutyryl-CoA dehydrogenase [Flexivirga endophytica]|uniref:3-hydroxybutyryl-CoA dehydrogenase n=1 Tax=Flexivirga endophytica TaxID=1849103 RepID=A0A916STI0_9MICO|nr:3-hydroxybutyryl-CoA dehydrogenase [Flexivirga endophytica]GGB15567.1 3-hydroxybutyryl-CoA dehydrogenase [Flexivirga endophytica]GHB40022.1 3-hydroxybutyryl-CoA dehydrogenase [Flexivirga endophytica]
MVSVTKVAVIGLGTMGAGIVEVFAKGEFAVYAVDGTTELAERGRGFVTKSLDRAVSKGKLTEADRHATLDRITFTAELTDLVDADLVIEAVPERMEIKHSIFTALDDIVRPDAILASNTSSLSLTEIAAGTRHPERVVGMHFFNPAPVLKLVEVIRTVLVDESVADTVRELALQLGKKPVVVGDRAGFVANALLIPYLSRAIALYETGKVSRVDLDNAGRVGIGLPMGPLTLCDLVGLDVVHEVCKVMYDATKRPSDASPSLLRQLVLAGRLGRKTGQGFYDYSADAGVDEDAGTDAMTTSAAVVGEGELATQLVDAFAGAGVTVTAVDGPAAGTADLAGTPLVVVVGGGADGGFDTEGDEVDDWLATVTSTVDARTVVLTADEVSEFVLAGVLGEDIAILPLRLHQETKGGQVAEVGVILGTTPDQVAMVRATLAAAGFVPIAGPARPGVVVDALLFQHLNDAVAMVDAGYATPQDVDTAMTAGCGYPRGLFAILDELGADVVADGVVEQSVLDPSVVPSPLLLEHAARDLPFLS